jgi:hypothetical protein
MCRPCEKDTYQNSNVDKATVCKACPTGSSTGMNEGSIACSYCDDFTYYISGVSSDNEVQCTPIPACGYGKYFDVLTRMCTLCSEDKYQHQETSIVTSCKPCSGGSSTNRITGSKACDYCSPGYYVLNRSPENGVTCTLCEADSYTSTFHNQPHCIMCHSSSSTGGVIGATSFEQCSFCRKGTYMEFSPNAAVSRQAKKTSFYCF